MSEEYIGELTKDTIDPALLEELHQLESEPREARQRFRRVYKNHPNTSTNDSQKEEGEIFYITPKYDPELERKVIYWTQIEETFQNVLYIGNRFNNVDFNQNYDKKNLHPLSFNTVLEVVLDLIIENSTERSGDDIESVNLHTTKNHIAAENEENNSRSVDDCEFMPTAISLNPQRHTQENTDESDDFNKLQCQSRKYGRGLTLTKAEGGNAESQTDIGIIYLIFIEDYSKSMEWFLKAADQGYVIAERYIGHIYFIGYGVFTKNLSTSLEWSMKAAVQGDAVGQNTVGIIYNDGVGGEGTGVEADYPRAMEWYSKAANQGYCRAQRNIASLYASGQGVPTDYSKALEWFIKAAKQGNTQSQDDIGELYNGGFGIPKDTVKALEWYQRAESQGETYSQYNIGGMHFEGINFPQDYSLALKWYLKSANQGNPASQNDLGYMYFDGIGTTRDYSKALWWIQKAAENDDVDGQLNMGLFYLDGHAINRDYDKAMEWFIKAAKQGNNMAKRSIGLLHQRKKNYSEAIEWYSEAAKGGDFECMYKIGEIFRRFHKRQHRDLAKALEWYTKAAENGHAASQRQIGDMYQEGECVSQDYFKALEWYRKAIFNGDTRSYNEAGSIYFYGFVPLDYHKAFEYFLKAADAGAETVRFRYELGSCYLNGYGTPIDLRKAKKWMANSVWERSLMEQVESAAKKNIYFHLK